MISTKFFIKRPIFTKVLSILIFFIGFFFLTKLPIQREPSFSRKSLTVFSRYAGISAPFMESQISPIIENSIKGVKGIVSYKSSISDGSCRTFIEFENETDINEALNETRSAIASIAHNLPIDMPAPQVFKGGQGESLSIWISTNSKIYNDIDLCKILEKNLIPFLDKIEGVKKVELWGGKKEIIEIKPLYSAIFKNKITPSDIESAIKKSSKVLKLGNYKTDHKIFSLISNTGIKAIEDLQNIIMSFSNGKILKLKDIAKIEKKMPEDYVILRCNGEKSISIDVFNQNGANDIKVSKAVKNELEKIRKKFSSGEIKLDVIYDNSLRISSGIKNFLYSIIEAIILVSIVLLIFLGSFRSIIIPLITIPVSLVGTSALMYFFNFSINNITLLALSLAVGMVVDDAIVMLENITRYTFSKKEISKVEATCLAAKEISSAVVSMTIVLAAVFIPMGFMEGRIGKYATEFSWTLSFAILISGIVALTLTPVLSLKVNKNNSSSNKFFFASEKVIQKVENLYERILRKVINFKKGSIAFLIIVLGVSFFIIRKIEKTTMPNEDIGFLMTNMQFPEGRSLEEKEKTIVILEEIFKKIPDINYYATISNPGGFNGSFLFMKDFSKRRQTQEQILGVLNQSFFSIPEATVFAFNPMGGGGKRSGGEISFILKSDIKYENLIAVAEKLLKEINSWNLSTTANLDIDKSSPAVLVDINKNKAAFYDISIESIAETIQGFTTDKFLEGIYLEGEYYEIFMKMHKKKTDFTPIKSLYIKNKKSEMVPIESVVSFKEINGIKNYQHHNGRRSIGCKVQLKQNFDSREVIKKIDEYLNKNIDKKEISFEYDGEVKSSKESNKKILFTFIFAIALIFLILAAQFESWIDPFIILLAVPFSAVGGLIGLWISKETLNTYSGIAFISLIGIAIKNSIMIVEFANQLKNKQKVLNAIVDASTMRFKPIMMTSISTILGALPLVFSKGFFAGAKHSMGIIIFLGILIGTFFTIFVVPIIYNLFHKKNHEY